MATGSLVTDPLSPARTARLRRWGEAAIAALWPILRSPRFLVVLGTIWIVDAALGGIDVVYRYAVLDHLKLPSWFDLTQEDGFGELWEYALTTLAALAMARLYQRCRAPIFAVVAIVFAWLTLDNAVGVHEWGGAMLAPMFESFRGPNLRPQDIGELVTFAAIGSVIAAGLWRSAVSRAFDANVLGLAVMACIGMAASFGVIVDFAHAALFRGSPLANQVATFIEEFGELTSLSLAVALTLSLKAPPRD